MTKYLSELDSLPADFITTYDKFNDEQKFIYRCIHEIISSSAELNNIYNIINPKTILLEAAAGTGKTFLTDGILTSLKHPSLFLTSSQNNIKNIKCETVNKMTVCKFFMKTFKLNFEDYKKQFNNSSNDNVLDTAYNLISKTVNAYQVIPFLTMFVDEYTLLNPEVLLLLYFMSKLQKFNIIFIGNKDQLKAINSSKHHQGNNYKLLVSMSDKVFNLVSQLRITDTGYSSFVTDLKNKFPPHDNIRNDFRIKYFVYEKLPEKFDTKNVNYTKNIFLSSYYINLKNRLNHIEKELFSEKDGETIRAPFYFVNQEKNITFCLKPHLLVDDSKFNKYLLLSKHLDYYLVEETRVRNDCKMIMNCLNEDINNRFVWVEKLSDKTQLRCYMREVDSFYPLEHTTWLKTQARSILNIEPHKEDRIYQFPFILKQVSTIHSCQGMTYSDHDIEIDIDGYTANAIYVGLSRVTNRNRLKVLHTTEKWNLHLTYLFNDEYYYRVSSSKHIYQLITDDDMRNNTNFVLCKSYKEFMNKTLKPIYRKYKKSANTPTFQTAAAEKPDTELMSITKQIIKNLTELIEHCQSVIVNNSKNITKDDFIRIIKKQ